MKNTLIFLVLGLFSVSCTTPGQKTAVGAGVGAAAGAGIGALMGAAQGKAGQGALIGAGIGAMMGGAVGNHLDRQAKELAKVAETKRTEQGIVTQLKSDILFDSGRSELKPQAKENINQLAEIIKKYPEDRLTIAGFTDNRGTRKLNQKLSEDRANAVRAQLASGGVPFDTITTVGRADEDPVAPNTSKEGQARNRRVEIHITTADTVKKN